VTTEHRGSLAVISLSGDIIGASEQTILGAYRDAATSGATKILLRFADGCIINSAGIAVLILMVSQARKARQKVGVVGLAQHYQKIFHMIGLTDYLTILENEEDEKKLL
jgi:stage II sporulation protein AA (anti-sigma F factor antagonist)